MELVQKKYIQTQIGLIPSDWKIKTLGDLAFVISGGTPQTNVNSFWNGNINWFTPTEVGLHKYSYSSLRKITSEGLENSSARILPIGTVLLTTRAGIGDVTILMEEGATNQGFQSFVANKNTNNEYLYYLISTLKKELLKNSSGSTFLEISPNKLKSITICLPPTLEEQIVIATALSNTDNWITNLENLLTKKRLIKQAVLQEMIKPKDGWKEVTIESLSKIFTKQTGFDYSSYIKPSLIKKKDNTSIPFIQNKDFKNKWINFDTDYFIPINVAVKFPRILLNERCLLISISGSVGNVGIFCNSKMAFIGGAVAIVKFKNIDELDWVMYYLLSDKGQNTLLSNVKSGSHKNLILEDIRKIKIPFPTIKEQKKIVAILSDMDVEIEQLETKLEKAKKVKQGMMQELLTGKTRLI